MLMKGSQGSSSTVSRNRVLDSRGPCGANEGAVVLSDVLAVNMNIGNVGLDDTCARV